MRPTAPRRGASPMIWLVVLFMFSGIAFGVVVWRVMTRTAATGQSDPEISADVKLDNFTLTDQDAEDFNSAELSGKVWLASFFFSRCPSECLLLNKKLAELERQYGPQGVKFVSISCDPKHDTPTVLREYIQQRLAVKTDNWKFLTGDLDYVQAIGRELKMPVQEKHHDDLVALIGRDGKIAGWYRALHPPDVQRMQAKIDELLKEEVSAPVESDDLSTTKATSFELTERTGRKFHSDELDGHYYLSSFFFTACTSRCWRMNVLLRDIERDFGDRGLRIVSITCDPEIDTADELRKHAKGFTTEDSNWVFLTGELPRIERIGRDFFDQKVKRREHFLPVLLRGPEGKTLGEYDILESDQLAALRKKLDQVLPPKESAR